MSPLPPAGPGPAAPDPAPAPAGPGRAPGAPEPAARAGDPHGVAPPAARPPAGPLALARARWAVLRSRGRVTAGRGAALGRGVRWQLGPEARVHLGAHCAVGAGTRFVVAAGAVRVGPGTHLGERCVVQIRTALDIGAGARLADEAVLLDEHPRFGDPERPLRRQGTGARPIAVGAHARIGPRTVVGGGARIGPRARIIGSLVVEGDVAADEHVTSRRPTAP